MQKPNPARKFFFWGVTTMAAGILMLGTALVVFWQSSDDSIEQAHLNNVEQLLLQADAATRGKGMSLATGQISQDVEGLFVLDHLTGNLSCIVLNPRNGTVGGSLFFTNVNQDLGSEKSGQNDYVLITGYINANLGGRAGRTRNANCVVYVADGSTGQVAGYTLRYNQNMINSGQGQAGALELVWAGASREAAIRREQN